MASLIAYRAKEYTIAGNLTFTIVKGLSVGGEVAYTHSHVDLKGITGGKLSGNASAWQGGVRQKRTF